ncbi:MAG: ABC transporter substrate-binding protein [Sulfolobales archaeon]|nr:ABC transporter substrate-binding protein [Sulfolobales archaeon]MCX8208407.1 ABC transporter substrate-binding protein [Sulfolobales archaeon]MDW8010434.1 ABC transporter substrate-binding protein [Sulfolobales archaeon]
MIYGKTLSRSIVLAVLVVVVLAAGIGVGRLTAPVLISERTVTIVSAATVTRPVTETVTQVTTRVVTTITPVTVVREIVSVVDSLGRVLVFDKPPGRVVSLAPSITEILFALGLGNRVVGVTSFCNYPPEVLKLVNEGKIAVIGGFWTPELEKILAVKPDLVIGSAGTPPHLRLKDQLEQAGIKVLYIRGSGAIDKYEVYLDIRTVARIFLVESAAEELIARMEREVSAVEAQVPKTGRPKVLILLGPPSWGLYSAGGNTFIGWVLRTAGGVNIAGRFSGWPQLDYEFIVSQNPDVIIVSAHGVDPKAVLKEIAESPLAATNAFKNGRIYLVNQEANDILMRPGPRLSLAVRIVASILYPEIFGEVDIPVIVRPTADAPVVITQNVLQQLEVTS